MAKLTIKEIAKVCNVSISTVSRAINNDPTINPKTRERVLQVVDRFNYVPNNSARNLKMTASNTIALMIRGISNPFFQGMLPIFEEELTRLGYDFLLHTITETDDEARTAVQLAKEKRLKGLIFLGGRTDYPDVTLKNIGVPFVLCSVAVNSSVYDVKSALVSIDDAKEACRMVEYLISQGHRRIAFINGKKSDSSVSCLRLKGYKDALEKHGIDYDPDLVFFMKESLPDYSEENGYVTARELLDSGVDFSAVFVVSDRTAIGVYKAIYDAGMKVPGDYSVAAFDGIEVGKYLTPALTTMVQPIGQMVKSSVDLLMEQINGADKLIPEIYETSLVIRESVRKVSDEQ